MPTIEERVAALEASVAYLSTFHPALTAPVNVTPPAFINPAPRVGDVISVDSVTPGTWEGHPAPDLAYALKVANAVKPMPYTIVTDDAGGALVMDETASNFKASVTQASNPTEAVRVLSIPGTKTSATIGSMEAGSKLLHVLSTAGFVVGDQLIVAVGGEAGQGKRGTVGVGGVYAPTTTWNYYNNVDVPRALVAKVVRVDVEGDVLELDLPAIATTYGAKVFFDNLPAWNAHVASLGSATDQVLEWGLGNYAVSHNLPVTQKTRWTVKGQGKDKTEVFSPDGARSAMIWMFQSPGTVIKDFTLRGNAKLHGFGLGTNYQYPAGIYFGASSHDSVARGMRVIDVFQKAVGVDYCTNTWAYNIEVILTEGHEIYIQWLFQWANSVGGGIIGGSIRSPRLTGGAEPFASEGTTFQDLDLVNATCSANSAWGYKFKNVRMRFEANKWINNTQFHKNNPSLNVNTNFPTGDPRIQQGGLLEDVFIEADGYQNEYGDAHKGIVVNGSNGNLMVKGGGYNGPATRAPYTLPNGTTYYPVMPVGLNSTGPGTWVDGFIGNNLAPAWAGDIAIKNGNHRNCQGRIVLQNPLPWPTA